MLYSEIIAHDKAGHPQGDYERKKYKHKVKTSSSIYKE
jgi:hypothetical protein